MRPGSAGFLRMTGISIFLKDGNTAEESISRMRYSGLPEIQLREQMKTELSVLRQSLSQSKAADTFRIRFSTGFRRKQALIRMNGMKRNMMI